MAWKHHQSKTPKIAPAMRSEAHQAHDTHFAWDLMEEGVAIQRGLELAQNYKLNAMVYVLIGYNTTRKEDLYRCQIINDMGFDPYPMPYNKGTKADRAFKRFICLRGYRPYKTLVKAWDDYHPARIYG